jgi:hypothetical protein
MPETLLFRGGCWFRGRQTLSSRKAKDVGLADSEYDLSKKPLHMEGLFACREKIADCCIQEKRIRLFIHGFNRINGFLSIELL